MLPTLSRAAFPSRPRRAPGLPRRVGAWLLRVVTLRAQLRGASPEASCLGSAGGSSVLSKHSTFSLYTYVAQVNVRRGEYHRDAEAVKCCCYDWAGLLPAARQCQWPSYR